MSTETMNSAIYWFRNDLRLHDNPAFTQACAESDALLPVYCLGSASAIHNGEARWGVMQPSTHRQRVLLDTLIDLDAQLRGLGSALTVVYGPPADILPKLASALGTRVVHCETIAATHEQDELNEVSQAGLDVHSSWQSSLFAPEALPFAVKDLPPVYTRFRQVLAQAGAQPAAPVPAPTQLPPLPKEAHGYATVYLTHQLRDLGEPTPEPRASVPYLERAFAGGERAALAHLARYFASDLPQAYKATRNGLTGTNFSS
jgi:deoxyribodipyrimidine photo-lyase